MSRIPGAKHLHFQAGEETIATFLQGVSSTLTRLSDQVTVHGFLLVSCICDFFIFSPENVLDQQKTAVVCYCSVGYRSSILAQKINSQGRKNPLVIINIKSFLCGGSENNSNPDPRF